MEKELVIMENGEKAEVLELALCEQNHLVFKPNQLYRFVAMPDCDACKTLMDAYALDEGIDLVNHIYTPVRPPEAPKYSLEQKRAYLVYESGPFIFLKLPVDPLFVRREGIDMQHCLAWAHVDYCRRMAAGEIEVYSMTDTRDEMPKVDIEVALVKSSYSYSKIEQPTVTQIRGPRNELPPKDEFIPALMDFFTNYGKSWALTFHGVRNFDGRVDGDVFMQRWQQLQTGQSAVTVADQHRPVQWVATLNDNGSTVVPKS
jgi:hypothetical protein